MGKVGGSQDCALLVCWVAVLVLVGAGEGGDPLILVRDVIRCIAIIEIEWGTGGVEGIERGSFIVDAVLSE